MATLYTVNASVFLNAFNPYEPRHPDSRRFLSQLQAQATPIVVPTLRWRIVRICKEFLYPGDTLREYPMQCRLDALAGHLQGRKRQRPGMGARSLLEKRLPA